MAFTNLYTKKTANPKDIDFAKVGTTVKNKIPEAAIKAFKTKVPGVQAKPFDFTFEKDYDTGKLQITVKSLGFVHGWVDETFAANKTKMAAVEKDIDAWKARVELSLQGLDQIDATMQQLQKRVEDLEGLVISGDADPSGGKEFDAVKKGFHALAEQANKERGELVQFWNGAPKEGVVGLIKKHGLPLEQLGGEKREADAEYAALQGLVRHYQEEFSKLAKTMEPLIARNDQAGLKLFSRDNGNRDKGAVQEEHEEEIQKQIGDIQGYKRTDIEGTGAKALVAEAKEFAGKAGAAWVRLSENPGEIDKTSTKVEEVFQRLRILGGRVVTEYNTWQKPGVARGGKMPTYQQTLKMVYDEYMTEFNLVQETLKGYKAALAKQRPKAVEAAAKAVKSQVKSDLKDAKAQGKQAVKQAKASGDKEAIAQAKAGAKEAKEQLKSELKQARAEVKEAKKR